MCRLLLQPIQAVNWENESHHLCQISAPRDGELLYVSAFLCCLDWEMKQFLETSRSDKVLWGKPQFCMMVPSNLMTRQEWLPPAVLPLAPLSSHPSTALTRVSLVYGKSGRSWLCLYEHCLARTDFCLQTLFTSCNCSTLSSSRSPCCHLHFCLVAPLSAFPFSLPSPSQPTLPPSVLWHVCYRP